MKKEVTGKKAEQRMRDADMLLHWFTAWLIASKSLPQGTDINGLVKQFFKEDKDMVQRFMRVKVD